MSTKRKPPKIKKRIDAKYIKSKELQERERVSEKEEEELARKVSGPAGADR